MSHYDVTKARIFQWLGIILIMAVFSGAYWYFKVYGSTLNQSQNDLNTNGLVGLWSFNGDDISGTTAYDRSGSGNNGTLTNGPTVTDGKVGQALDFFPNGSDTNAYVTMGDPVSGALDFGTGDFSVGFWMKGSGYSGQGSAANVALAKKNFITFTNAGYGFWYGSSNLMSFTMANGTTAYSAAQTVSTVADNQWHHYVGTRSGTSTLTLYVDGVPVKDNTTASGSVSNSVDFIAGTDSSVAPNDRNADAVIDEVRIYNRAITASEVASLYTQGGGTKVNTAVSQPQGTGRLDSGLAGYWKMDDGSGTSATDASTNGNTGTLTNGPTWTTGQIGGAVDLDGTNDYITTGTTLISADSITLSAWVNASGAKDGMAIFGNINGQTGSNRQCLIYDNAGVENLTFTDGLISLSITLGTGTWQHIVYTNRGTTNTLYLNGVKIAENTAGSLTTAAEQNVEIGSCVGSSGRTDYFQGKIDEARLYRRALSADEVAQLYRLNTPTSVDTSLKGYWSFNAPDMTSTTAYDQSGAGDYGVLSNSPAITEGVVGQALLFDGNNDYVNFGVNSVNPRLSGASAITVATWMKPLSYPGNNVGERAFDVQIQNGTVGVFLGLYDDSGLISFGGRSQTSDSSQGTTTYAYPSLNEWHHVIGVMDIANDVVRLYVDGALVTSVAVSFGATTYTPGTPTTSLDTLGSNIGFDQFYHGALDETRVYNRALTTAEIKSLYDVGQSDKVNSSASQPQGTGRLDSGLAGYWKLDDGTSGATPTSAADSSTNGNNGTLTNSPTWTTGQIGNAVTFDGTNDYISMGNPSAVNLNGASTVSVCAWVNLGVVPGASSSSAIAGRWQSVGGIGMRTYTLGIGGSSTSFPGITFFKNTPAGTTNYATANVNPSTYLSQWHHFCGTYDSATIRVFDNGALVGESAATGVLDTSSQNFYIGAHSDNSTYLNGKIDEVRVYNRTLSADEVAQLYRLTSPTGTDTSLKGYWSFNGKDLSGTTAYDRSGAGNNGTLTNGPAITEGKLGQALNFDGADDYVTAGSASVIDNIQTLTVSAWIKTRTYSNLPNIFNKAGVGGGWQVNLCQNSIGVCANAGQTNAFHFVRACEGIGTVRTRSPENSISTNTWQHLAITNDNSAGANTTKFYVNGSLVATDASACVTPRDESSNNLLIGSANGGGQFDGLIDEARLYNRVLTESEIKSLYNSSS